MEQRIIGFIGYEGAGKTTAAEIAADLLDLPIRPFARYLKDMLRAVGIPEKHLTGTTEEKAQPLDILCGKTARHAMQTLGTEWRDTIGRDLWLNLWLRDLPKEGCVVDDVRFPHEAEAIKRKGGVIVRVIRPNMLEPEIKHASQNVNAIAPDRIVYNGDDRSFLRQELRRALATSGLRCTVS